PPAAQAAMYVRAHRYYQFFLTTTKDGGTDRLRATVGLSTVDAALRRLDRDPTSIRPLAQGTARTPATPSPAPGAVAMELLSMIDPVMDTLEGQWAIQGGRLRVAVDQARNVLAVPVKPQGSYRLQIRFARVRGSSDVNVYLPIGSRGVELIMSSHDGAYSGLNGLKGIAHHKEGNPTTRSGKLINSHVYELDIEVGHRAHQCSIDVQLDGQPYLTWNGPISDLPNTDPTIRLRTHHARALYHSIKLTMRDGVAKHARTGKVLDQARPDRDRGIELLAVIDLSKDRVHGQISLDDGVIRISPDGARPARLEIPVVPEGSYHLRLRFRRTHGDESMNAHLPVGRGRVLLVLGGYPPYSMSGLESIGGKRVNANDTATKAFKITTGKLHQAKITVRRGERQSTIEVDVDGQRVISWTGDESQLSVWQGWDLPHRGTLGLGTPRPGREARQVMDVLSANLKMISGRARFLRTPQDSPGPDANAPELLRPAINAKLGNKGSTWHFDWSPVAGATEYEIHVMGARAGRPVLHTKVPKPPHDFLLRGGISGANLPGWRWKVRAISDGRPGPWSTPRTFDVVPPTRR
ncbi:MAG: hypothetical protein OER86_07710, partial [Phycisphaerae bacterium]|nr:hypothetical protein [Phycisphaerae bacterium]